MATQQAMPEASVAAAHAPEEPGRGADRPVPRRSWRAALAWPLRAGDGIWLQPTGPVPGAARGSRVVGPLLAAAVAAFAAAQYAIGRPIAPEAWLAIAPLLGSLALRPLRTALLAGWTVVLGLGLTLLASGPPGRLASSLNGPCLAISLRPAGSFLSGRPGFWPCRRPQQSFRSRFPRWRPAAGGRGRRPPDQAGCRR